jgi:hypothetical protein
MQVSKLWLAYIATVWGGNWDVCVVYKGWALKKMALHCKSMRFFVSQIENFLTILFTCLNSAQRMTSRIHIASLFLPTVSCCKRENFRMKRTSNLSF